MEGKTDGGGDEAAGSDGGGEKTVPDISIGKEQRSLGIPLIEDFYFDQLRIGIRPTVKEMQDYCRKARISPTPSLRELRQMRYRFSMSAIYSRNVKPTHHFSAAIDKPGMLLKKSSEAC